MICRVNVGMKKIRPYDLDQVEFRSLRVSTSCDQLIEKEYE